MTTPEGVSLYVAEVRGRGPSGTAERPDTLPGPRLTAVAGTGSTVPDVWVTEDVLYLGGTDTGHSHTLGGPRTGGGRGGGRKRDPGSGVDSEIPLPTLRSVDLLRG